jgi:hypothetical protein
MAKFNLEPDTLNNGKYIVTVNIIIYRQLLGCYPSFLAGYNTPDAIRDGFTTKFWYICNKPEGTYAEDLTKDEAEKLVSEYTEKYETILTQCEDSGNWENSPFDFSKLTLIYSK